VVLTAWQPRAVVPPSPLSSCLRLCHTAVLFWLLNYLADSSKCLSIIKYTAESATVVYMLHVLATQWRQVGLETVVHCQRTVVHFLDTTYRWVFLRGRVVICHRGHRCRICAIDFHRPRSICPLDGFAEWTPLKCATNIHVHRNGAVRCSCLYDGWIMGIFASSSTPRWQLVAHNVSSRAVSSYLLSPGRSFNQLIYSCESGRS